MEESKRKIGEEVLTRYVGLVESTITEISQQKSMGVVLSSTITRAEFLKIAMSSIDNTILLTFDTSKMFN